jgi:hypothetical protein
VRSISYLAAKNGRLRKEKRTRRGYLGLPSHSSTLTTLGGVEIVTGGLGHVCDMGELRMDRLPRPWPYDMVVSPIVVWVGRS